MQIKIGEIKLYSPGKFSDIIFFFFIVVSLIRVWNLNVIRFLIMPKIAHPRKCGLCILWSVRLANIFVEVACRGVGGGGNSRGGSRLCVRVSKTKEH